MKKKLQCHMVKEEVRGITVFGYHTPMVTARRLAQIISVHCYCVTECSQKRKEVYEREANMRFALWGSGHRK